MGVEHTDDAYVQLTSALIGLGYLTADWPEWEEGKLTKKIAEDEIKIAVNAFRTACGWNPSGRAGSSVSYELSRQVGALQTKLATLDCYSAEESYKQGVYDQSTRTALERFQTRYHKNIEAQRSQIEDRIEKYPVLKKYGALSGQDAEQWFRNYQDADYDELATALTAVGFLKTSGEVPNIQKSPVEEAAHEFCRYAHSCLSEAPAGVCGESIRAILRRTPPFIFDDILDTELSAIAAGREAIHQIFGVTSSRQAHPISRAHEARLMGLAFSGGGIRSATFNLGVLQALARVQLLRRFDYLSSVSGGGYISGWLHAWVCREKDEKPAGIVEVEKVLASTVGSGSEHAVSAEEPVSASSSTATAHEPGPVAWLRRYSNYLTPRLGPLGADTMAAIATWLRNVILNQTMLLLVAAVIMFFPWWLTSIVEHVNGGEHPWTHVAFVAGCLCLAMTAALSANATSAKNPWDVTLLRPFGRGMSKLFAGIGVLAMSTARRRELGAVRARELGIARMTLAFLYLACVLIAFSLSKAALADQVGKFDIWLATSAAYALPSLLFLLYSRSAKERIDYKPLERRTKIWRNALRVITGLIAGSALGGLLVWFSGVLPDDFTEPEALFRTAISGPPAVLGLLLLAIILHIGLAGRALPESAREWWSRIGGMAIRIGLLWLVLTCIALYGAFGVMYVHESVVALGGLAWAATTLGGVLAARSASTDGSEIRWRELLARTAPYVFVAGLVVLVSWGLHGTLTWAADKFTDFAAPAACEELKQRPVPIYELSLTVTPDASGDAGSATGVIDQPRPAPRCDAGRYATQAYGALEAVSRSVDGLPPPLMLIGLPLLALVLALLLGTTVDINVFAFHMFYRNRLERCYLGASHHETRQAHPYTDLDPKDSPRLDALILPSQPHGQRPYPLINTALNLTHASNLAWQERKAGSFVFTPQHCGYQLPGLGAQEAGAYQRTSDYVKEISGWLSLGAPITVSGAAASPNSGYHTHAATAALMALFNVRLGMWIQNPRRSDIWRKPGPKQSLKYLLKELLASATEKENFVYISDGGHFENLGLYELVRRRCRYVMVCDAGCDSDYSFEDLGNAVRKCKVDLGIDIDIDTRAIKPDPKSGLSGCHCAIGVIHYEQVDTTRAVAPGYLLYVKASFTGDEPADVRQYRAQHPAFPHESTGDQWYSESQFESYRALGFHVMSTVLEDAICDERRERHRRDAKLSETMHAMLKTGAETVDREVLFKRLAERWCRPSSAPLQSREHEQALQALMARVAEDSRLRFLDPQIYPEWPRMTQHLSYPPAPVSTMFPLTQSELRAGFYFCDQLIQLMGKVYDERNLEQEHDHPDNRGWMNLFRHWSASGMFRVTWAVCASNYGARFQQFCGRHLGLDIGRVQLGKRMHPTDAKRATEFLDTEELEQLSTLEEGYVTWDWKDVAVVPMVLTVEDPQDPGRASFWFTIGFALIQGYFSVERGPSGLAQEPTDKRRMRYFRIRKHLRRMGLGRRGLEAFWREDAQLEVDIPENIVAIIDESEPQRLLRIWHSVLAAVPHQALKAAHDLLDLVDQRVDREIDEALKDEKDPAKKAKRLLTLRHELPRIDDPELVEAHELYLQALAQQSDNEEAWRGIARIKAYRRKYDEAFNILGQIIKRDPKSSLAYYNRAALRARTLQHMDDDIFDDLKRAIELDCSLKVLATRDEDFQELKKDSRFIELIQ